MADDILEFDLKRKEIILMLKGADGIARKHFLRELDGVKREEYMDFLSKKMTFNDDGKPLIKNMAGLYPKLLELSLADEHYEPFGAKNVGQLPATVQEALFKKAMQLNGLSLDENDKAEKSAKNA